MSADPLVAMHFANSRYAVRGRPQETIGTAENLSAWLRDHALVHNVNIRHVDIFVELRDAIRAVFQACADGEAPQPESLAVINKAAAAAPSWPALTASYEIEERTTGDAPAAARAAIARGAMGILGGPLRADLRACRAPGCVKFFVRDHPRREWCCDHCGNRARAARHYRRHRPSVA
jgi:predicted RNA-binding Zn ribbon-like protein